MGLPATKRRYTVAEYLRMEEKARDRHEFHDGEILAMSGSTYGHDRVKNNLFVAITYALKGKRCHPLSSDMRMRVSNRLNYFYPDISVVCGKPQFDPDDPKQTTIISPRVILEVLSISTESYDRRGKFDLYRQIPSLQEYVLVSQNQPLVEIYRRRARGTWLFDPAKGLKATAKLSSLKISVPLREIYAGVDFEALPNA